MSVLSWICSPEFQSTLPRRERRHFCPGTCNRIRFQSTLPRRERQSCLITFSLIGHISIHAPAKGATATSDCTYNFINNFNPRSREGSDNNYSQNRYQCLSFQSTLPRRERRYNQSKGGLIKYFNPRSREGSDSNIIQQISFSLYNTVYFVSNNIK